jgi:hypothetical protein
MKILWGIVFLAFFSTFCGAAERDATGSTSTNAIQTHLVFREPFTLNLRVDKDHVYEERYERKIPYVADDNVYLFSGESFGLKLVVTNGEILTVTYQKEQAGSDIGLEFRQDVQPNGDAMMLLVLKSHIKKTVYMDALMTTPGRKGIHKTTILPLQPGLTGYESWPHPIVQLVLGNLRLQEKPPNHGQEGTSDPVRATD